jgi:dihydrofolate reductase
VLTKNKDYNAHGAIVVGSKEELLAELAEYDSDEIYIIGGESIYNMMLPYCDTAYVTKLDYAYDADTFFPNLDQMEDWEIVEESEEQTFFDIEFTFRTYKRK